MRVSELLRKILVEGPMCYEVSICGNLMRLMARMDNHTEVLVDWDKHSTDAFTVWPESTGDTHYPVPGGEVAYLRNPGSNKWTGSYGNARRRLLRHLIVWFQERGM